MIKKNMTVNRFLIGATTGVVAAIIVASIFFEASPLLWFVDTSPVYMFLRFVMVLLLVGLLVTNPPRSVLLRSSMGVFAAILMAVVIDGVMAYKVNLLDVVMFTEVAIILGIEALEKPKVSPKVPRSIPVK